MFGKNSMSCGRPSSNLLRRSKPPSFVRCRGAPVTRPSSTLRICVRAGRPARPLRTEAAKSALDSTIDPELLAPWLTDADLDYMTAEFAHTGSRRPKLLPEHRA